MADRFDSTLELLPADGPDVDPDDAIADALATDTSVDPTIRLPLGRGWAFDFNAGEFVLRGQSPAEATGLDNLRYWIEKTARTARFAHPIYSDEYGTDYVQIYGAVASPRTVGKYTTALTNALLMHDRISEVKDFKVTSEPNSDTLELSFVVVVDEEDDQTELQIDPLPIGTT